MDAMAMLQPSMAAGGMATFGMPQYSLTPMDAKQNMAQAQHNMAQHGMASHSLLHQNSYGMAQHVEPRSSLLNARYGVSPSHEQGGPGRYQLQGGLYYQQQV